MIFLISKGILSLVLRMYIVYTQIQIELQFHEFILNVFRVTMCENTRFIILNKKLYQSCFEILMRFNIDII